jgi:hypothetical protein
VSRVGGGRWLLATYPRDYAKEHGEQILATFAETRRDDRPRRIPLVREILALLYGGLVTRPRHAARGPVPWWADGLHLGVFVLALTAFAPSAVIDYHAILNQIHGSGAVRAPAWWYPWAALLPLLIALALMRGWARVALVPAAIMAFGEARFLLGAPGHPLGGDHLLLRPRFVYSAYPAGTTLPTFVILAGLIVLAVRRRPRTLRHRSWLWWLPVLASAAAAHIWYMPPAALRWPRIPDEWWSSLSAYLVVTLVVLTLWATAVSGDLRWALAVGVTVTAQEISTLHNLPVTLRQHNTDTVLFSGGAMLVLAVLVMTARTARRRT